MSSSGDKHQIVFRGKLINGKSKERITLDQE